MEMRSPRIAVLVLGYNDEHNLREAIDSVLQQTYVSYDVVYIDNASTDSSLSLVRETYPQLRVIAHEKNLGYAGAYARVLQQVFAEDYDGAVLLNSDVVVDSSWLRELVASAFKNDAIAIAQSKIFLHGDGGILANTFGNRVNYLGFGFCGHYRQLDNAEFDSDRDISSASGASLLVKKDAYREIGGLDESFFAYLEDQDLSWRALLYGYRVVLSAKSLVWHKYVFKKNSRNNWKLFALERNRFYFLFKNFATRTLLLIAPMFVVMEMGMLADALTKGYFLDKMRAYGAFLRSVGALVQHRRRIQRDRQKGDSELVARLSATVDFEELRSPAMAIANRMLASYFWLIRSFI